MALKTAIPRQKTEICFESEGELLEKNFELFVDSKRVA